MTTTSCCHQQLRASKAQNGRQGEQGSPFMDDEPRQETGDVLQADAAYALVKQDILNCDLAPGLRMTEADLVERYQMGRASVRSALKRLYQEGLVDVVPRLGYTVAPLTIDGLREIFQLQLILEPQAAKLAAGRVDSDEIRRLDRLCGETYERRTTDRARAYIAANKDFHIAVAAATGNTLLKDFVQTLYDRFERFLNVGSIQAEIARLQHHTHEQLVEALIHGDSQMAGDICARQLRTNHALILEAIVGLRGRADK